jgi:MOSC domain-containing protein YiiM
MRETLQELLAKLPNSGRVEWLGLRPERKSTMLIVDSVTAQAGRGLAGDRYSGNNGKRQVTLIQSEHLIAIASFLHQDRLDPALLRRNIAVSGINLLALKGKTFHIGTAVFEYTGLCHPCSAMETTFGAGGYNAVRGHGGITARVLAGGVIRLGDELRIQTTVDDDLDG